MKVSLPVDSMIVIIPAPVFIVGTYDADGRPNAMAAAWAGMCCHRPPSLAVALRAATYTHGCILSQKCFTVSIPSVDHVAEADYLGIASGRDLNKFEVAGLTPVRAETVPEHRAEKETQRPDRMNPLLDILFMAHLC